MCRYVANSVYPRRLQGTSCSSRKAAHNSATIPKTIKTDRLRSYDAAIDAVFGGEVKHIKSDGLAAEINNNRSERLQGTYRERTKTMRGLQSRQSGQRFLDGWTAGFSTTTCSGRMRVSKAVRLHWPRTSTRRSKSGKILLDPALAPSRCETNSRRAAYSKTMA